MSEKIEVITEEIDDDIFIKIKLESGKRLNLQVGEEDDNIFYALHDDGEIVVNGYTKYLHNLIKLIEELK